MLLRLEFVDFLRCNKSTLRTRHLGIDARGRPFLPASKGRLNLVAPGLRQLGINRQDTLG